MTGHLYTVYHVCSHSVFRRCAGTTAAFGITNEITKQFLLVFIALLDNLPLKLIDLAALLCFIFLLTSREASCKWRYCEICKTVNDNKKHTVLCCTHQMIQTCFPIYYFLFCITYRSVCHMKQTLSCLRSSSTLNRATRHISFLNKIAVNVK